MHCQRQLVAGNHIYFDTYKLKNLFFMHEVVYRIWGYCSSPVIYFIGNIITNYKWLINLVSEDIRRSNAELPL